jgi:predicted DNA-binding transcriptional regulator YafY
MMRRADRLFRLVEIMRSRRLSTGSWLAEQLGVSLRTLYRDIADLSLSGVPIEGEAGVGYRLRYRLDVPPLLFDPVELEALLVGSRMVQAWGDNDLAQAATAALAKIHNVLPELLRREAQQARLFIPPLGGERPHHLTELRDAVRERRIARMAYVREDGTASQRSLWPLGLFFWGRNWTLIGWCLLRGGFRHFRVDRIQELSVSNDSFPDQKGRRLNDFFDELERKNDITIGQRT